MPSKRPANPLALAVLVLLYERPMHPYEMSSTLRERRKEDSIKLNYGSLYSVVESLQKYGLVDVHETVREGRRPERTVYAITDAGLDTMTDWLGELLSTPAKEFPQFEAALSLMPALPVHDVVSLLEKRLAELRRQLELGENMLEQGRQWGLPRLFSVEHELEVALKAAEANFVGALLDDLRSGSFEGLGPWQRMHELRAAGLSPDEVEATINKEFKEEFPWLDRHADPEG